MQVAKYIYKNNKWNELFDTSLNSKNTLILIFASLEETKVKEEVLHIAKLFPLSIILGSSTSVEIINNEVYDDTIVVSVVKFQSTILKNYLCDINNKTSYQDGVNIAKKLFEDKLKYF